MPKGNRKGGKQSVQTCKKRKGYNGVRKQDKIKRVRLSEASPVASITFVHGEDVVADCLPETPISAAEKKLGNQGADFSSDEEDYVSLKDAEGYRFIAISSLRDTFNRIHLSSGRCKGALRWSDVAVGAAVGTAAVAAAPVVLGAVGFTAGGVAAGSIAAGVQSAIYGGTVASGSVFSVLQSVGAAGIGMKAGAAIFTAATGAGAYVKNLLF